MVSKGKQFEKDFKDSVPKEYFYYRFIDNAASFGQSETTRFTSSNMCDNLVVTDNYIYFIELKTHTGSSLPLSCIRENQVNKLSSINHKLIRAVFIINFRDKEETYLIDSKKIKEFIDKAERKSIPIQFCRDNGIKIPQIKKKVHYKYELKEILD